MLKGSRITTFNELRTTTKSNRKKQHVSIDFLFIVMAFSSRQQQQQLIYEQEFILIESIFIQSFQ